MSEQTYQLLWDKKDVVSARVLEGKRTMKRITVLARALNSAADRFGKASSLLPRQMEHEGTMPDTGSIVTAGIDPTVEAMTAFSDAIRKFSSSLLETVHLPLSTTKTTLIKEAERETARGTQSARELERVRSSAAAAEKKAQRTVDSWARCARDLHNARSTGADQSKVTALEKKTTAAEMSFRAADMAHKKAVTALSSEQMKHNICIDGVLIKLQGIDIQRVEATKNAISELSMLLYTLGVDISTAGSNLGNAAQSINSTQDCDEFALATRTGAEREDAVVYTQVSPSVPTAPGFSVSGGLTPCAASATVERAVAIYDFDPEHEGCIPLEVGCNVEVIRKDESGWWYVRRLDSQIEGNVPADRLTVGGEITASHVAEEAVEPEVEPEPVVELVAEPATAGAVKPVTKDCINSAVTCVYDFDPQGEDGQLIVQGGETMTLIELSGEWSLCQRGDETGYVPTAYLSA